MLTGLTRVCVPRALPRPGRSLHPGWQKELSFVFLRIAISAPSSLMRAIGASIRATWLFCVAILPCPASLGYHAVRLATGLCKQERKQARSGYRFLDPAAAPGNQAGLWEK